MKNRIYSSFNHFRWSLIYFFKYSHSDINIEWLSMLNGYQARIVLLLACVAVVTFPRAREAREGMEREKEQKKELGGGGGGLEGGGGGGGEEGKDLTPPNFFLLLFVLHSFTCLPRSQKGNNCYTGYPSSFPPFWYIQDQFSFIILTFQICILLVLQQFSPFHACSLQIEIKNTEV